jgi:NAD(P)H-hydrate repair Nnr-like enzyme with NAD(P)H-hydrate dehydratase domain
LVLTLTAAKQVVGPGLGRDPAVLKTAAEIIRRARAVNLPLVIDADGLHVVTTQPELVRGYEVSTVGVQEASAGGACVACFATLHPALNPTLR